MKKKINKIIAVFLAINILFEIISPTVALALTTGPGQPELQSFEPVGTTEMVDPFSGDFNYNIPLMTVPGPNGGYPINLAYHAGIGMEQEASWVGLGWNVNAGEINRQMRGLPDDFNGDLVTQQKSMRSNITASVTGKVSAEFVDFDGSMGLSGGASLSLSLIWNSYKGIGVGIGQGVNAGVGSETGGFGIGLHTQYNSLTGQTDLSASLAFSGNVAGRSNSFGLTYNRNSLEGIKSLDFTPPTVMGLNVTAGAGVSFSGSSFIPNADVPQSGYSIMASFDAGADIWMINPYVGGEASFSLNRVEKNPISFKAFGYMYSQNRDVHNSSQNYSLMDVNREKDVTLTKDIPALPMPSFTNDVFFVKGQGIGGAFRPYRSDIGILQDPVITSKNVGTNVGLEIGVGNVIKVGTDVTLSYSKGYSGPWRDGNTWADFDNEYRFQSKATTDPLFEPYYFKNAGDMTANYNEEDDRITGIGTPFPIKMICGISASDFADPSISDIEEPIVDVKVNNAGHLVRSKYQNRQSRSQMMSTKTLKELRSTSTATEFLSATYSLNTWPRTGAATNYSYINGKSEDQIGEVSVMNADGNRYIYAIPAYNNSSKEVSFSVEGGDPINTTHPNSLLSDDRIVTYSSNEASVNNNRNAENLYASKTMPAYAHSYLLTAIVSPDYVDLTGDGLTSDDFGYYTKFNYTKISGADYRWRVPYRNASFIKGFHSTQMDDIGGYAYGTKEIWYLNSIETKTHVAEFHTSARRDGRGAADEKNDSGLFGQTLQKLDRIDLYSNPLGTSGTPTLIKSVNFDYTYDLCGYVDNNDPSPTNLEGTSYYTGYDRNLNHGKLTLKKVSFTYMGNTKGALSPYEFDYKERVVTGGVAGAIDQAENPNFSTMKFDRWGNYKNDSKYTTNGYNEEDPYTIQRQDFDLSGTVTSADADLRNKQASAWCLKSITLPSGGQINIDYESDDYAYVQDRGAMQMSKIVGVGTTIAGSNVVISGTPPVSKSITGSDLYVYFELEKQDPGLQQADIFNYVKGINNLYFNAYEKLKHYFIGSNFAFDYVSGYAKLGGSNPDGSFTSGDAGTKFGFVTTSGTQYGFLKLAKIDVHDSNYLHGVAFTNPFRKAGWQYLKLSREDLLAPSNTLSENPGTAALLGMVTSAVGYFASNVQLLTGYYNYCIAAGYCKEIEINDNKPSFIRVNSADKIKYGGGHRVKRIVETDAWSGSSTTNEYGQEYTYLMPDGTSSGVAEYEPLIGGEEIPLHQPVRYNSEYFIVQRHDLYMELPYCESYYPAASVGYSRVIVKGIEHKDASTASVTKGVDGVTLYEFYTAKDFPVIVKDPSILLHEKFTPDMSIPFIGDVSFENHGFSQDFTVETNDMHGKLKAVSTYPYSTNLTSYTTAPSPVSNVNYIYKTDAKYSPTAKNQLNNTVDVLFGDAYYKTANIGLTKEHFMDMRERSSVSMTNGGQINASFGIFPPFFMASFIPRVAYSERLNKTMVSMHVNHRNGILIETLQSNEGSTVSTKNLMFDAANGEPLLTTVTNNFDAPVYSYDYAAHWMYDGMDGAYKNGGAEFSISSGGGVCTLTPSSLNPINYLSLGDQVALSGSLSGIYWVTNITASNFTLKDKLGVTLPTSGIGSMKIMRSGRRNLQDVSSGTIVALSNPIVTRTFPLFVKWNSYIAVPTVVPTTFSFDDCSGQTITIDNWSASSNVINFNVTVKYKDILITTCQSEIDFPAGTVIPSDFNTYTLKKYGSMIVATKGSLTLNGTWKCASSCLTECVPDVLHAEAIEFKQDWSTEIGDVLQDVYNNRYVANVPSIGEYSSGKKGIWRSNKTNLYQTDRQQPDFISGPGIAKAGTYNDFALFDWTATNPKWFNTSAVTKVNPYGFEIENKNALGIYSSALYGYDNALQTAVASNASYYEIAYDGFEDYLSGYARHGHINLSGTPALSSLYSHTGKKSLLLTDNQTAAFTTAVTVVPANVNYFIPQANKTYKITAWFKSNGSNMSINITGAASTTATVISGMVEGWRKIEKTFTTSGTVSPVTISLVGATNVGTETTYLDDLRIQPLQSDVKTYVYDQGKLWLKAELDNQNFATYYNYDEEGTMFQVKKETEKGVSTLKTTRTNIKQR